jgi:hypothetical protein
MPFPARRSLNEHCNSVLMGREKPAAVSDKEESSPETLLETPNGPLSGQKFRVSNLFQICISLNGIGSGTAMGALYRREVRTGLFGIPLGRS